MPDCCVPFCKSKKVKGSGLSFHEFPSKMEVRMEWLKFVASDKSTVTDGINYSLICSLHFKSTDFLITPCHRTRLNPYAIPTIFQSYVENKTATPKQKKRKCKSRTSRKRVLKRKKIDVPQLIEEKPPKQNKTDSPQIDDPVPENAADAELLSLVANSHRCLKENSVPSIFPPYTAEHGKCKLKHDNSGEKALKQNKIDSPQTDDQVPDSVADPELLLLQKKRKCRSHTSRKKVLKRKKIDVPQLTEEKPPKRNKTDSPQIDDPVPENTADAELLSLITNSHKCLKENSLPSIFPPYTENNTSEAEHRKYKLKRDSSREKARKQNKTDSPQPDDQVADNVADAELLLLVAKSNRRLKENAVPSIFPSYTESTTPKAQYEKCEFKSPSNVQKALKQKKIDTLQTDDLVSENITDAGLLSSVANSHRHLKENAVPSIFTSCTENNSSTAEYEKCNFNSPTYSKQALEGTKINATQTGDQVPKHIEDAELVSLFTNGHFSEKKWKATKSVIDIASKSTQTNSNIMKELEKKDVQLQSLKAALVQERKKMKVLTTEFLSVRKMLKYYEANACHQALEQIMLLEENEDNERAKFLTEQILNFF